VLEGNTPRFPRTKIVPSAATLSSRLTGTTGRPGSPRHTPTACPHRHQHTRHRRPRTPPPRPTCLLIAGGVGLGVGLIPRVTAHTGLLMPFAGPLTALIDCACACAANLYGNDGTSLADHRHTRQRPPDVRGRLLAWILVVAPFTAFEMLQWEGLAGGPPAAGVQRASHYQEKVERFAAVQRQGLLDASLDADHVVFAIIALAAWWQTVPQLAAMITNTSGENPAERARRRALVVELARRMAEPKPH
jgi:Tetracyclin repressor-like, C-terminal domain